MTTEAKKIILILCSTIISFYAPVHALIMPVVWLVVLDILTAIYYVRVVQKQSLTSRGFFKKLPQVSMFLIAVAASIHANPFFVHFGLPEHQASKLVFSFYGLYELFSILENLGKSGLPVAKQIMNILSAKLPDEVKKELGK